MSDSTSKQVAHMVFFKLKESTAETRQALVDSCKEHLADIPGMVYFGAGERGPEFQRPVNDADYDVGLHVVFESKQAHDVYQEAPGHLAFLAANKETWESVRIFDSYV